MLFVWVRQGCTFFKHISRRLNFEQHLRKTHNDHCWRTHTCGELRRHHINNEVTLCGWVEFKRPKKFIVLRDWNGSVQLLLKSGNVKSINLESVIRAKGIIKARPDKDINPDMETGDIEMHVDELDILNACSELPFPVHEFSNINEDIRMQYRYLDIRSYKMQHNLRVRSKIISSMREFLTHKHGFIEVETPTLFRPTPGGAREFIVPSPIGPNLYYSLPQSPQQFKQLLMVGGIDRYFQVARCYRDEGSRPDRQPEFSQIDLEMSFVSKHDVINLTESMIKESWPVSLGNDPFPNLTLEYAMEKYGTDKPDTRFEMILSNVTEHINCEKLQNEAGFVYVFIIPSCFTKVLDNNSEFMKLIKLVDDYFESSSSNQSILKAKKLNQFGVLHGKDVRDAVSQDFAPILDIKEDDIAWIAWDKNKDVRERLGKIRLFVADVLGENGVDLRPQSADHFLWITDFPMFKRKPDGSLKAVHHPFTAPHPDDIHILETDPTKVRSLAYDLVLNGSEVAGGSIRIHDSSFQRRILEQYLKIDSSQLEHFLRGLNSGAPPHGGIAIGLDRLIAEHCRATSIRDVMAFPKTTAGRDLMCGAPCPAYEDSLTHYFMKTQNSETF